MIYRIPAHSAADEQAIERIERLRSTLRHRLHTPRRWHGTLRRTVEAAAVQGSNTIEGLFATVENAAAILDGESPADTGEEVRKAIIGYRDAMTYILRLAPTGAAMNETLLKSLHFMMLKHELDKNPGEWRPGPVWVVDSGGNAVYEAPDRRSVDSLMAEMLAQAASREAPAMVTASMAHLNLALIHPFSDGNGRMARCAQSFVLAASGEQHPWFASIEEHLGLNTSAYYEALTAVAQGSWSPRRDARSWIEFTLTAHYRQVQRHLRRIQTTEALWAACERQAELHGLADRSVGPMCDAARGWRMTRPLYIKAVKWTTGEDISATTATRDLAALVAAGCLSPVGERRGRTYDATPALAAVWSDVRAQQQAGEPIGTPYQA